MSLTYQTIDRNKTTPMMQQYLDQKEKHPDCLLFFRLGDFYELFLDDAVTASRELELALTGRDCGLDERAPMCGVPYHAADNYLNRLVTRGFKVAICEQVEDPATAKGIVRREVIRVVTPGTITDTALLDEKAHNYIVSIYQLGNYYGLAACDLTTGTFDAAQIVSGQTEAKLIDELARYRPAEIVCQQHFADQKISRMITKQFNTLISVCSDDYYSQETVKSMPELNNPDYIDTVWSRAAASLLLYLQETQHTHISHIRQINPYSIQDYMQLGATARKNLEISSTLRDGKRTGSLLWAIDKTNTSMGSRLLRRWIEQPLINRHDINMRLDAVTDFKNNFIRRQELRDLLQGIYDLERLTSKIALKTINARDLLSLNQTLHKLPAISEIMRFFNDKYLIKLINGLDELSDLRKLIEASIDNDAPLGLKEGGLIKSGFDQNVDKLREAAHDGKNWIVSLENSEREKTGIKNLKIRYNRIYGFYIEVTKSYLNQVPDYYIRRQTLTNAERFVTAELKEMEDSILGAEQKSVALEYEIFCQIRDESAARLDKLKSNAAVIAQLDVLSSLAEQADRNRYCRPEISVDDEICISQGRHPVVEKSLKESLFVPNDTRMNMSDRRCMILTGPNMAGKSTYMRQVALIVLLAQIGSYVPAESARIGLVDQIFTRVGASDDLTGGQSTFMVEMNEVADILKHASDRSLLILDEIGRGTSTYDGLSIAWAVIEQVTNKRLLGCRTLFATHYHELTDLEGILPGVFNSHIAVDRNDGEIVFLHQIRQGGADQSYGIEVARLAGVPQNVVQRSQEILLQLEKEHGGQHRIKIKSLARPMEGQIDLFASSTETVQPDLLRERLKTIDVHTLTPLDALNLLFDLQKQAHKDS